MSYAELMLRVEAKMRQWEDICQSWGVPPNVLSFRRPAIVEPRNTPEDPLIIPTDRMAVPLIEEFRPTRLFVGTRFYSIIIDSFRPDTAVTHDGFAFRVLDLLVVYLPMQERDFLRVGTEKDRPEPIPTRISRFDRLRSYEHG
jgi:hypothetical protein